MNNKPRSKTTCIFSNFWTVSLATMLLLISLFFIHGFTNNATAKNTSTPNNTTNNKNLFATTPINFSFSKFNQIKTVGNWSIAIKHGNKYQVKIFADKTALTSTTIEQHGNILYFTMQSGMFGGFKNKINAEITLPSLNAIDASDGSNIMITGFNGNNLSITLAGMSHLNSINNNFQQVNIDSSGASKIITNNDKFINATISISGAGTINTQNSTFKNLSCSLNGASKGDLATSKVTDANVSLSGASRLTINMNGGVLKGNAYGASKVIYKGTVQNQEVKAHGVSSVTKK